MKTTNTRIVLRWNRHIDVCYLPKIVQPFGLRDKIYIYIWGRGGGERLLLSPHGTLVTICSFHGTLKEELATVESEMMVPLPKETLGKRCPYNVQIKEGAVNSPHPIPSGEHHVCARKRRVVLWSLGTDDKHPELEKILSLQ